jgi:protein phosphatase
VDLAGYSHPGKVRPNNEDNFLVIRFGRFLETLLSSLPAGQVPDRFADTGYGMLVADGMGGMAAGEVASRKAITAFVNQVLATPDWVLGGGEPEAAEVIDRAARRFRDVNEAVVGEARARPGLSGMGTTLTLACSLGADLLIAHVGDSPAYLYRGGGLHRLTRDHTLAQELADRGAAGPLGVPARFHHVLTQAIGIPGAGGEPDVRRVRLEDGDRLLLCTDGLTKMVDEAAIAAELRREGPADAACRALIELALEAGGRDNVTAVLAGYRIPPPR